MARLPIILLTALLLVAMGAVEAAPQDAPTESASTDSDAPDEPTPDEPTPDEPTPKATTTTTPAEPPAISHDIDRGAGGYLSWVKILLSWLVFLTWVGTTDWVSRDAQAMKLNFVRWNPIVFGTFLGAFVLLWLIPYFWLGFSLLLVAYVAPLTSYIVIRNSTVDNNQRVLTPAHLRFWFSERLALVGVKIETEARDEHEKGPPVTLVARGGADSREDGARLLTARQAPGLTDARRIIADGLSSRGSSIMLDFTQQNMTVRVTVDGVWLARDPMERETGDPALEALKILCGLKPEDRQNRQKGAFAAEFESVNYEGTLTTQGTKTGERALIQFEDKKIRIESLDALGMRAKMQEQVRKLMSLEKGFLLISAMPAGGLRTVTDVVLNSSDRFLREFVALEDEAKPYEQIENVPVTTYKGSAGETPATVLLKVFRIDPNVVVVRDLVDGKSVDMLAREAAEDRLVVSTMRAKDSAEALLRVLATGADAAEFAGAVSAVLYQRLIRKLCEACKEAYQPTPKILQQLGIPAGRVQALYRPPQEPEKVCEECQGVGYIGRTAILELLVVGDTVRKVLTTSPKLDLLRKAARKDGLLSLQEEGILLVAKGVTSLPELMRALKQ